MAKQKIRQAFIYLFCLPLSIVGQNIAVSDNGDGTFTNPILHADYSDPDVIRVGDDYWLVASSFNCSPGLPILHSKDLVNWELVNYAFRRQPPDSIFQTPQYGGGAWAQSIRFHKDTFYIYYPDPDFGIYVLKTTDPRGKWSAPVLMHRAKGWIDPGPFWDDDGKAYLLHAMAASRAGVKSILLLHRMSEDGLELLDDGNIVYDGHRIDPTIECPKMHKRNGFYYIFAPAGGVPQGW